MKKKNNIIGSVLMKEKVSQGSRRGIRGRKENVGLQNLKR